MLGKTMVANTKPQQRKKEESERLTGKRDRAKYFRYPESPFK